MSIEIRKHITLNAEIRATTGDNGARRLEGYAALFNTPSGEGNLDGFRERVKPGAFTKSLKNGADVRCLLNHDANYVLGRTKAGTLRCAEDSRGLRFVCDLPDTQTARDIHESIKRGDIDQCSFAFRCISDAWSEVREKDGSTSLYRDLLEVDLLDVSAVTYPVYEDTSVDARARRTTDDKIWQEHAELELRLAAVDLNS